MQASQQVSSVQFKVTAVQHLEGAGALAGSSKAVEQSGWKQRFTVCDQQQQGSHMSKTAEMSCSFRARRNC